MPKATSKAPKNRRLYDASCPSCPGSDMTPVEDLKGFSNADVLVKPLQRRPWSLSPDS